MASFMAAIKSAISIETLDRRILSALIEKIVVHEREKARGKIHQQVEIHYKFVGSLANLQGL
ncbi:DUF4368 domain-containing protein [Oscillospiraceae bacterium OttesenSCG-928-G22]|nr:DUF4368 domain-containing protein [Oscillospiraceae bacterium OttesenSCG-928-G22]